MTEDVIMEVGGISSGRDDGYDGSSTLCLMSCFLYPEFKRSAIRRIHPTNIVAPVLRESIVLLREVAGYLGISWGGANVQSELELVPQG